MTTQPKEQFPLFIEFSPLEEFARVLAFLTVLSILESDRAVTKMKITPEEWKELTLTEARERLRKRSENLTENGEPSVFEAQLIPYIDGVIKVLSELIELNTFLGKYAPDDEISQKPVAERMADDPFCFSVIRKRLLEIRYQRGICIIPNVHYSPDDDESYRGPKEITLLSVELYAQMLGYCYVMQSLEIERDLGTIPNEVYMRIALDLIDKHQLDELLTSFLKSKQLQRKDKSLGFDIPLEERLKSNEKCCFGKAHNRLIAAHDDIFPVLATGFVEEFFLKYATTGVRGQVEKILNDLQWCLTRRRQCVGRVQYDELPKIDEHYKHLLATLKEYGIKANTYDEALRAYERRFPSSAPKDDVEQFRENLQTEVQTPARFREVCEEMIRLHPEFAEQFRWATDEAIRNLRHDREEGTSGNR